MKRNSFLTVLLVVTSFFVYGQSNDEKAIRQVLTDLAAANRKADVPGLDNIYSADYVFISPAGKKSNKTERLAIIKATPAPEVFEYVNPQIRLYGNTAVVNTEVKIKPKGQGTQNHWVTIVMVKKNGKWAPVNAQATPREKQS